jgi:hypothetical protein
MAVFEIQFDVLAFLDAQRARFRSERFCPPAPLDFDQLNTAGLASALLMASLSRSTIG